MIQSPTRSVSLKQTHQLFLIPNSILLMEQSITRSRSGKDVFGPVHHHNKTSSKNYLHSDYPLYKTTFKKLSPYNNCFELSRDGSFELAISLYLENEVLGVFLCWSYPMKPVSRLGFGAAFVIVDILRLVGLSMVLILVLPCDLSGVLSGLVSLTWIGKAIPLFWHPIVASTHWKKVMSGMKPLTLCDWFEVKLNFYFILLSSKITIVYGLFLSKRNQDYFMSLCSTIKLIVNGMLFFKKEPRIFHESIFQLIIHCWISSNLGSIGTYFDHTPVPITLSSRSFNSIVIIMPVIQNQLLWHPIVISTQWNITSGMKPLSLCDWFTTKLNLYFILLLSKTAIVHGFFLQERNQDYLLRLCSTLQLIVYGMLVFLMEPRLSHKSIFQISFKSWILIKLISVGTYFDHISIPSNSPSWRLNSLHITFSFILNKLHQSILLLITDAWLFSLASSPSQLSWNWGIGLLYFSSVPLLNSEMRFSTWFFWGKQIEILSRADYLDSGYILKEIVCNDGLKVGGEPDATSGSSKRKAMDFDDEDTASTGQKKYKLYRASFYVIII